MLFRSMNYHLEHHMYAGVPGYRLADLRRVMEAEGFTVNPTEWWHWSHGDQAWAAHTGASTARYGPARP